MNRRWIAPLAAAILLTAPLSVVRAADDVPRQDSSENIPADSPVADALRRAEEVVTRIIMIDDSDRTFQNTVEAIDDVLAQLELDTNIAMFLAYVSTDPVERERGQRAEEDVQNWLIDFFKREDLFKALEAYSSDAPEQLSDLQERLLEHTLRDFRRAGMSLPADQRAELVAIEKELNRLSIEFEKSIREDETTVPLTRDELAGMPDDWLEMMDSRRVGDIYLVGMSYPQFIPLMDHCDDEIARKKVWIAYKRRGGQKNVQVLERILELRAQAAHLLGYENPADYVIEVKMAKEPEHVMAFYEKLRPLVREKARLDYEEFVQAKREHTDENYSVLFPWDTAYYQNRLLQQKYAVDSQKVQEYFPLQNVIDGLFSITQSLYGLQYQEVTPQAETLGVPIPHEDVRLYEVTDTASGNLLGHFTIDLHPRADKYTHAAQWGLAQHKVWSDGKVTKPLAALVCNFTEETPDKPSLLTHEEVETFFHEFGHCLHTILSDGHYWRFSGTGVERDFVEAPSQMFENWVWDADVLETFARHYDTGEPIPDELVEGMLKARHLGSGLLAERQFYYGLFDMHCHLDPKGEVETTKLALDLWGPHGEGVELYAAVPNTYFHAGFGHLTGYEAGYYGYQWSLVYASDMFQRFKELGMLDPEAGMYYRQKILSQGGSKDGLDLVRDYLGREPEMTAYLEHLGLEVEED